MTRNGWYPRLIKQTRTDRLVLDKESCMFFVIPRSAMDEKSVVMGHFAHTKFGDIWSTFLQFVIFVLKVAFIQLSEIGTPPGNYPIRTYLMPITNSSRLVLEYMLIINASPDCPIALDALFAEAARSVDKILNMAGKFIDLDPKRRETMSHRPGRRDAQQQQQQQQTQQIIEECVFDDYRNIDSVGKLDKLLAVYARRSSAQTVRDMNAFEALKAENAVTWVHEHAEPHFKSIANYLLVDGSATIPLPASYYAIEPTYCDPATFFVQIKPHLVCCENELAFNAELQGRLIVAARNQTIAEDIEEDDANRPVSARRMPSWAVAADIHQALGASRKMRQGEVHENDALAGIRFVLQHKKEAIEKLFVDGEVDEKGKEELILAARTSVMRQFERMCMHAHSGVSKVAREYHQYAADREHMAPMKVPISDPELSGMANFQIYMMEVLAKYLGVATHTVVAADMWVILSSMFSTTPAHLLLVGDGGGGKSYMVNQVVELIGRFAKTDVDTSSAGRRWAGGRIFDGMEYTDEIDLSLLVNGGSALNELKALLSKGYLVREVLEIDKNTSERSIKKFLFVQQQSHVACMNKDEAALHGSIKQAERQSMEALISRYILFNVPQHNHEILNINSVSQGTGRLKLERPKDVVVAEFVLLMRWMMIVQHLIFCEVIPDVDMSQFEAKFAQFDEVISPHKVSNNIRQTPKIRLVAKTFALVRSVVEHFCVPGAPFYGKPYSIDALMVMPLVCTLEDVTKACTTCFSMYIPRDLSTITSVLRKHITTLISDNASQVTFANPRVAQINPVFRRPADSEDIQAEQTINRRRNAAAAGLMPGGFEPPDGYDGAIQRADLPQPVSYACLSNTGRYQLEKELNSLCHKHVSKPSGLSMGTCIDIMGKMKLPTSNWMNKPGSVGALPHVNAGDTRVLHQFALEFSGNNAYINLELVFGNTIEYSELWRTGIEAMCDKHTIERRVLTGIQHPEHPFLACDYRIRPTEKVAVAVNPEYISRATSVALTGHYDPATVGGGSVLSRAQLIELDMDSDMYYLVQNYLARHPRSTIDDAVLFARMEHPVSKMMRARAAVEENLPPGAQFCFSVYPDERIAEIEELIEAKRNAAAGMPSNAIVTTTTDIIDLQRPVGRHDTRVTIEDGMRALKERNSEARPGERLALMYGIDVEEGMKTTEVVDRAMRMLNQTFYSPMALPAPPEDFAFELPRAAGPVEPAVVNVRDQGFVPPRVVRRERGDAQAPVISFPDEEEDDEVEEIVGRKRPGAAGRQATNTRQRQTVEDD